jgi:hypothetical protein
MFKGFAKDRAIAPNLMATATAIEVLGNKTVSGTGFPALAPIYAAAM